MWGVCFSFVGKTWNETVREDRSLSQILTN